MDKVFFLPEGLQRKKKNKKIFSIGILVIFLAIGMLIVLFFFPLQEVKQLEKESNRLSAMAVAAAATTTTSTTSTTAVSKQRTGENSTLTAPPSASTQSAQFQQRLKGANMIAQQRKLLGESLIFLNNASDPNHSRKGSLQRAVIEKIKYAAGNILIEGSSNNFIRIIEFVRILESSREYTTVRLSKVEAIEGKSLFLFFMSIKLKE